MKKLIFFVVIPGMILLLVQFPHTLISPGDLIQVHQLSKNDCFSCHQPFGGISNEKCIACHKLSDIGKDSTPGTRTVSGTTKILFHESLSAQQCISCHTDHKGTNPTLVISSFKHEMLPKDAIENCVSCHQKPVDNLHQQLTSNCKSCHSTSGWKSSVTFNHDMLEVSNKNNCASCHQKPGDSFHQSLKDNCNKCHSTNKWSPATFNHTAYFELDKDHNTSCKTCHINNNYSSYTCYGCHEHTERNIIAEHNEERIYNIRNCVACHRSGEEGGREGRAGDDDDD